MNSGRSEKSVLNQAVADDEPTAALARRPWEAPRVIVGDVQQTENDYPTDADDGSTTSAAFS